ncbi:POC1 centriolar protein like [Schistosoma japonicum]|nr:POC1 centriolar protein like [Schistosoma japonicum]
MDSCLMIWNIKPQTRAYKFTGHKDAIFCVRFSPTGELIVTASRDKTVKLWVPSIKGESLTFRAHTAAVRWLDVSADNLKLCTASADKSVKVSHSGPVHKVACHPNGHILLSASEDSTLKIFDLLEGRPLYTLQGHQGPITAAAFSTNGDHFASGGNDEQVFLWRTNFDKCTNEITTKNSDRSPHRIHTTSNPDGSVSRTKSIQINSRSLCPHSGSQVPSNEADVKEDKSSSAVDIHEIPNGDAQNPTTSVMCHFPPTIHSYCGVISSSTLPLTSNVNSLQANSKTTSDLESECQNVPPLLSTTLEHIVSQLDILTQTVSLLEQRLTFLENKSKNDI